MVRHQTPKKTNGQALDDLQRTRLIESYLKRRRKPAPDRVPKTVESARRRFVCTRLTVSGCDISGEDCAKRFVMATARWSSDAQTFDPSVYTQQHDRNDQACAACEAGAARAELLQIKSRRRVRNPKRGTHGPELTKAFEVSPADVETMLARKTFTRRDLRALYGWTENTIKKWLASKIDAGQLVRDGRKGQFVLFTVK